MKKTLTFIALFLLQFAAPTFADENREFRAPSGNILCNFSNGEVTEGKVRCDIINRDHPHDLLPKPKDCEDGWGNMFILNRTGKAGLECAGDLAANPTAPILEYEVPTKSYGITCLVQQAGLTCINEDGHGFSLSRAKQKLF